MEPAGVAWLSADQAAALGARAAPMTFYASGLDRTYRTGILVDLPGMAELTRAIEGN